MVVTLDLETSIFNKGNPFDTRNFIVTSHIKCEAQPTTCHFYTDPDFIQCTREAVDRASLIIGCHIKFDLHHLGNRGIKPRSGVRIWDVMLAEYVLSGQTESFSSLNSLAEKYGLGTKEPIVAEYWAKGISTEDIPKDIVESYGNHDVNLTRSVYDAQRTDPRMNPQLEKLIMLMGLDLLVLQDMESNGFKYNTEGSLERAKVLQTELTANEEELQAIAGFPINWDSGDQLSVFLYGGEFKQDVYLPVAGVYKSGAKKGLDYVRNSYQRTDIHKFGGLFKPLKGTAIAKSTPEHPLYQTAEDILQKLKATSKVQKHTIELLLRRSYLAKLCTTYLVAFPALIEEMHWADNTIHGQFNQVVARTGRLSSSRPNMQNAPEEVDEFFVTRYS